MKTLLTSSYNSTVRFLKSTDFSKAFLLTIAITSPITVGVYLNHFDVGLAMALGAILSSPSDVSGSFRHTKFGILLSISIAVLASLLGGYLVMIPEIFRYPVLIPVMGVTIFAISYLSVYGFRASLISFSGLLAIVLSFAALSDVLTIFERSFFIGIGGLLYFAIVVTWKKLNPKTQTEQYLRDCIFLTASYMKIRGKLIDKAADRNTLRKKLLQLQTDLNEKHEVLREILISSRKTSGNSNYERKRLLIFMQLIDILELAVANPVNYTKLDKLTEKHPEYIPLFQDLIFEMVKRLKLLSDDLVSKNLTVIKSFPDTLLNHAKSVVFKGKESNETTSESEYFLLQNLLDYQELQIQKIKKIEEILNNSDVGNISFLKKDDATRFITHQGYDVKILKENFSLKSPIFRHSLRIALVIMIGFAVGAYFSLQNSYWILLTIVVIMRPNYGLTKTRSKQRTLGTLMGAAIAIGIIYITQNHIVYGFLGIVSLLLALALTQKNYRTSAIFITLSVVFIYALLQPNVLYVIQYRVLDTLIGAGLATIGSLFLWPAWEFTGIKSVIAENIKANTNYLKEIFRFYPDENEANLRYRLTRKEAFLATGNLSASFQRMTQEPKSKQKNLDTIYEIVVINHTILSSLASLGTNIKKHQTEKVFLSFKGIINKIENNLSVALDFLESVKEEELPEEILLNEESMSQNKTVELNEENIAGKTTDSRDYLNYMSLMEEELKWILALSEKLIQKFNSLPKN